jgi:predicted MPP superfamily phosphohydrolase
MPGPMRRALVILIGLAVAAIWFGLASAVQDPVVARYTIPVPGLTQPVKLVQLSDIHASRFDMPPARIRRIVAMANARGGDVIVLTGDFISGYPGNWSAAEARAALAPLAGLSAPRGVFAVLGNHDSPGLMRQALAGTGVQLLIADSRDIGPLTLVGADDLLSGRNAVASLNRAVAAVPTGKPLIAIAHEPDFLQWLPKRVPLLIAGHTHGGQIVLPLLGTMPHNAFIDAHLRGFYREHGQMLLVSSGLGTSVLPFRIGVTPEMAEITLVPAHSAGRNSGTDR